MWNLFNISTLQLSNYNNMFNTETYIQRRSKIMLAVGDGLILLMGNDFSPMNYTDNAYHFRQDSNFLYFTGLNLPVLALTLHCSSGEVILYGNEQSIEDKIWMGPQKALSEQAAAVGIEQVRPYNELAAALQTARASGQQVHYLPPYRGENKIQLFQYLGIPFEQQKERTSAALIKAVISLRERKSPAEIVEMEKALAITKAMYLAVMKQCKPGMKEAQLAGIAHGIALAGGGELAYPIILTKNGQVLHNHEHHHVLQDGDLVLADMGAASAMQYAADITRTFPVNGKFSSQQKDIYQIVLNAQLAAIDLLRPGIKHLEAHLKASKVITEGLKSLNILKGDTEEIVALGAHALFFPHGLGHMIGLDVHDMEDLGEHYLGYDEETTRSTQFGLKSLRMARELEEGHVMTSEPGLYFIPDLIDKWQENNHFAQFVNYAELQHWRNFSGVRIEDDVLVTANGPRIIGPAIPKTIEEVEAACQG